MKQSFHLCFEVQSDFRYLPFLTRIFKALKTPEAPRLTQILIEAYNNAVIHAHKRKKEKWIGIDISLTARQKKIQLIDEGNGFRKTLFQKKAQPWKISGRGLQIIAAHANRMVSKKRGKKHLLEVIV